MARFQELLYEQGLPPIASSLARMRRGLVSSLPLASSSWTREDVQLLSTELFANAIRHSNSSPTDLIDIRMFADEERVRVEVEDVGAGFDRPDELAPPGHTGGYGLHLVNQLAMDWGVRPGPRPPTAVWFELSLAG